MKSYSDLILLPTFEDRLEYLKQKSVVGQETFAWERYLNQTFYKSREWRDFRNWVISRDQGCDMALPGHEIFGRIVVHHINAVSVEDIVNHNIEMLLNPNNAVCVSHSTHEIVTYGDKDISSLFPAERYPDDTCPWKKGIRDERFSS